MPFGHATSGPERCAMAPGRRRIGARAATGAPGAGRRGSGPARRALRAGGAELLRTAFAVPAAVCAALAGGCQNNLSVNLDDPQQAAFVRLMMPRAIEVQRYLTRPVNLESKGAADGIEVILAALDRFDDPMKVLGTFYFELYAAGRPSDGQPGERLALWNVAVDSERSLGEYWDRASRYYRFPLRLDPPRTFVAGRFVLEATYVSPWQEKLFDSYEFEYARPAEAAVASGP